MPSWMIRAIVSPMGHENEQSLSREIAGLTHELRELTHAIHQLRELCKSAPGGSLEDLRLLIQTTMSKISEFVDAQNAFNDRLDTAVTGLQGDVKFLTDTIAALQASPGTITPADQALLDALQARTAALTDKLEALDSETPPAPPPVVA